MVTCCSVPGCHAREPGHRFPKDPERLKKWLDAIRRDNFTPTDCSRVCKKHFKAEDYALPKDSVRSTPIPQLKKTAVPSVFFWQKSPSLVTIARLRQITRPEMLRNARAACFSSMEKQNKSSLEKNERDEGCDQGLQCEVGLDCVQYKMKDSTEGQVTDEDTVGCEEDICSDNASCHVNSQKEDRSSSSSAFHIKTFVDKPSDMHYYTGFENYDHFLVR